MRDVGVFGAAGYSGLELLKLLAVHPEVRVAFAASDARAGRPVEDAIGVRSPLAFVDTQAAKARAKACAAVLLAVPHAAAPELAKKLDGTPVIDLSNAHRATPGVPYGLTALFANDVGPSTRLVANPGCYATAVITAAAPLVEHDLIDGDLVVCASSGVTGAGRQATEAASLGEAYGDVRAYKVLRHQHVPEIEAALRRVHASAPRVTLTTHLLPVARGILATLSLKLRRPVAASELIAHYRARYGDDPTVTIAPDAEAVSLRRVVGTNQCLIGVTADGDRAIVTSAIDNLLKGAAGQAVENLNLLLGLPRTVGLTHLARHA